MLAASQDIDGFIERQRSKLNKQPNSRPQNNRPPPPPPPQPSVPPNNVHDRLDYKVARIFDDPPRHGQSQQPYYPPPSPPSYNNNSISEQQENYYPEQQQQQQQQRRLSDDNTGNSNNPSTFFNKFGTYDDKRSQLKDDLKREYNEYLQSQKRVSKSKSTSQLETPHNVPTNKRVQFQQPNGKVVAPWEKNDNNKTIKNVQSMNDLSSTTTAAAMEYSTNRSRPQMSQNPDEQYIRDREAYISELHSQIRELETRRKQLEIESNRLSSGGPSTIARTHYTEDLSALNSLLAERLDQRNAVDHELAHILNRPPLSSSPTRVSTGGMPNLNMSNGNYNQGPPQQQQRYQQPNERQQQPYRNNNRAVPPKDNGFQIGQEIDKDSEQAQKKRYQQELQAQMREAQMRKAQAKQDKDEYERKLDEEIQRYNYFGRGGGGGAPMRDKEGNVVANLADVRNPQPPSQQQQPPPPQQQQQQYYPRDDKVYSLGNGTSSISNAPFYNGEQEQHHPSNTDRAGSPNHTRGAGSNGMFGTAKTEVQYLREEKYKQDLKQQIDEKRQRAADEAARRRAEEERELAKHLEWQQQMDRQTAEDATRKQEREVQDRLHHQQMQEELERQRKQEEIAVKRKPRRQEKPATPQRNDDNNDENLHRQNSYDEQPPPPFPEQRSEPVYRTSSPPIPALKNKGKKPKSTVKNPRRQSFDEINQQQSPPPLSPFNNNNNDDFAELPPIDDEDRQSQQTYRKPPTPRQPDVSSARKKPPQTYRSRPQPQPNSNSGMPMRTNSTTSLRSDGSDSEVLNRLEHLKRQLKDKEARLQDHVKSHQTASNTEEQSKMTYQPPTQAPIQRKQSPQFLLNAARVHHHRESPTNSEKIRRMLQTDDEMEFKPNYFRDDAILMGGQHRQTNGEYYSSAKRVDSANRMFTTNIEREANRRRYGNDSSKYDDHEDPTTMANYELNRIAEQNEHRLKKLRDLEKDDVSLLDSNEVLERFQQKQRLQRGGSQTTLQDDAWLK